VNVPVTFGPNLIGTTNIGPPIQNPILSPKYISNKPSLIKSSKYISNKT
jgi:hypothetical protein